MRYVSVALLMALCSVALPAGAQVFASPVSLHPANIDRSGVFLILVEDAWSDGCGGAVTVDVQPSTIEILSTLASPMLGAVCPTVVVPFKKLINPRDLLGAGEQFAEVVTVNYRFDSGAGPQLVYSQLVIFDSTPNLPVQVQSGGWITQALESSGLFVDQQGAVLSAALKDYGADGEATWYYTSGTVSGNVYSGKLISYSEVVCVTAPCPRAAPVREGQVQMLLRNRNELIVEYENVLLSAQATEGFAFDYQRLVFNRSPQLEDLPLDIPDLVGSWVGGVRGTAAKPDDFRALAIDFHGVENHGGITSYVYRAIRPSQTTSPPLEFEIVCADFRPVDGGLSCLLERYSYAAGRCDARFDFGAVGVGRVQSVASCDDGADTFQTSFELFRMD